MFRVSGLDVTLVFVVTANKHIERQGHRTPYYHSRDKIQAGNNVSLSVLPCYPSKHDYYLRTISSIIFSCD